jgi:hypothetical protein
MIGFETLAHIGGASELLREITRKPPFTLGAR